MSWMYLQVDALLLIVFVEGLLLLYWFRAAGALLRGCGDCELVVFGSPDFETHLVRTRPPEVGVEVCLPSEQGLDLYTQAEGALME